MTIQISEREDRTVYAHEAVAVDLHRIVECVKVVVGELVKARVLALLDEMSSAERAHGIRNAWLNASVEDTMMISSCCLRSFSTSTRPEYMLVTSFSAQACTAERVRAHLPITKTTRTEPSGFRVG